MAILIANNELQEKILREMARNKNNLQRQQRAIKDSRKRRNQLIRDALNAGMRPVKLARFYGLNVTRIWQIAKGED